MRAGVRRFRLTAEMLLLFTALPTGFLFHRALFGRLIIPMLVAVGGFCLLVLLRDRAFDRRRLWRARPLAPELLRVLRVFVPGALLTGLATWLLAPELLFSFPRARPGTWLLVMLLYPLLSVYPQEVIFRAYFLHRYRPLIPGLRERVIVSAILFGYAHVLFGNWLAPAMTTAGGWLFARSYARSRSLAVAVFEHALWGDFLFTVGLGAYFYGGAIR